MAHGPGVDKETGGLLSMKITIEFDFKLGERVKILELENRLGRVVAVTHDHEGVCYKVRYFQNGEVKTVYLYADELLSGEPCNEPA